MGRPGKKNIPNGKHCTVCGNELTDQQNTYCGPRCTSASRRVREREPSVLLQKREAAVAYRASKKAQPPRPFFLSDAEQREIDRRVDDKHRLHFDAVTLRPGDAGFEEAAAACTPLLDIKTKTHGVLDVEENHGLY